MPTPDEFDLASHAFSPVISSGVVMVPFAVDGDRIQGWPVYVAGSGDPSLTSELFGRRYVRVTALQEDDFAALLDCLSEVRRLPNMGRVCEIGAEGVVQWLSTRDPELLEREREVAHMISDSLGVDRESIGLSGSLHYRPRSEVNDIDFVVYGEDASRHAASVIRSVRESDGSQLVKYGVTYQSNFRLPGSDLWFDPRFIRPEHLTAAVLMRDLAKRVEPFKGMLIVDDTDGLFYPPRYRLEDGSELLSFRLGHNGLFTVGDRLTGPPLPVLEIGSTLFRVSINHERFEVAPALRAVSPSRAPAPPEDQPQG